VHYRAGAPVAVGVDSDASNVWPSVAGETGPRFSSGGRLTGEEEELLLAPDDDSGLNLQDQNGVSASSVLPESEPAKQRLAHKRLGFLSPVDGETPHRLLKERLYLGRDADCDVVVPGLDVAPLHCVMELRDGYWHVRNLRDNGVTVNGKKLSESWLVPGTLLSICGHEFSVEYEPEGVAPVVEEPSDVSVESDDAIADPVRDHDDAPPEGLVPSAAETTSGQSLAKLAAEADALFSTLEFAQIDSSNIEAAQSDLPASGGDSITDESADQLDDAPDDSITELASSKTFLLFEEPDDDPAATVSDPADDTALPLPESGSRSASAGRTLTAARGGSEPADDDNDCELKPASTAQTEIPALFDEDDSATAETRDVPVDERPAPSTEDQLPGSGVSDRIYPVPALMSEPSKSASPIGEPLGSDAGRSPSEPSRSLDAGSTPRMPFLQTARSDVAALIDQRHQQLTDYLAANSLDGLMLTRPSSISWLTAGSDAGIGRSNSSALIITRDHRTILHRDVDTPSLTDELLSGFQFKTSPFDWKQPLANRLEELCTEGAFASDAAIPGSVADASSDIACMRLPMERPERHELRRLGHQVAHAVEATLRSFHRGATEAEIAGHLSNRLFRHGVTAEQIQVYADERRGDYRRIRFDRQPVEDGCTLSVIARRNGLHVAASRTVCFGTPEREILDDHALSLVIQATALVFSKHQWAVADTWKRVHRIYEKFGRADQSLRVEPGWVTGYELCETPILPESDFQLLAGMPVVWQAGVGTALSVDTVLIADGGIDILTPCEFWPTRRVAVKRIELQRPDILIRNDD
jgi:Xaa-Pro aminopeptidase